MVYTGYIYPRYFASNSLAVFAGDKISTTKSGAPRQPSGPRFGNTSNDIFMSSNWGSPKNCFYDRIKVWIKTVDIDLEKTMEIAWDYKIYAYDAFYLETAKRLKLPLLSFDSGMKRIGNEIGLTILGGQNASI